MASPREQADNRSARTASSYRQPLAPAGYQQPLPASGYRQPLRLPEPPRVRRHHFHDVPPWPHRQYGDYIDVAGFGWWPRWYPYWDQRWIAYWWYLYDYYGGDGNPDYAEYARDMAIRQFGPQWGLRIGGSSYGYGAPQVGIQAYGVAAIASRSGRPDAATYRGVALDSARKIYNATRATLFGYRDSPWGTELTAFGTRAGLQRWANEQAADTDVWYAAAFDLGQSSSPLAEVSR